MSVPYFFKVLLNDLSLSQAVAFTDTLILLTFFNLT